MIRGRKKIAAGAMLILLVALCIPALSGALAADENLIDVPIGQSTEVFDEKGASIGTLQPDSQGGAVFQATKGDPITGVRVQYRPTAVNSAKQNEALAGKTKVQLALMQAVTPVPETAETKKPNPSALPEYGWIDANLVITALSARLAVDQSHANAYEAEIVELQASIAKLAVPSAKEEPTPIATPTPGNGNQEKAGAWVAYAALALGIVCAGALGWIALSVYASRLEKEHQTAQLKKLNERFASGVSLNSVVKVEQVSWPKTARVEVVSDALNHMAANSDRGRALALPTTPPEPPKKMEPPPVPEGEEPHLLALANSLVGVASSVTWRDIVREAGWRAVLLQANPTEKGTYIADDSGFSIIAALMRGAEADIAYIVPSYQDPNASEKRWHDFYAITESESVRRYRVDALPVMFIEKGVFFLPKSKGRLTRRPQ